MQLASRNPLLRHFFCKAYWATPFKMHFDLRQLLHRTFAELSRTYPYPQTPAISRGRIRGKANQGPWCLALAKPHFCKLGCCIWSFFLETSESNVRQYQRQVQGCASRLWYLAVAEPHLRKLGCYLYEGKSKCAVPFSCRTPGGRRW